MWNYIVMRQMTIFRIYTKKPHFTSLGFLTQLWKYKKAARVKIKKEAFGEFPDGTVVRTQSFHCFGPSSMPGWGTKIPQAMLQLQKIEIFFFKRQFLYGGWLDPYLKLRKTRVSRNPGPSWDSAFESTVEGDQIPGPGDQKRSWKMTLTLAQRRVAPFWQ